MDGIDIKESKEKITFSETTSHNEASLINSYQAQSMAYAMAEKKAAEGPQRVNYVKLQIQIMEETISSQDKKAERLKEIFAKHEINVSKRTKKLREIYTDEEIINRIKKIVANSKTEMKLVNDKYEITTTTTNEIEDLLIEYMEIESNRPARLEKLLQEKNSITRIETATAQQEELLIKIKERLNAIREFFSNKGKNIDKLLDAYANARPDGKKVAETLQ